ADSCGCVGDHGRIVSRQVFQSAADPSQTLEEKLSAAGYPPSRAEMSLADDGEQIQIRFHSHGGVRCGQWNGNAAVEALVDAFQLVERRQAGRRYFPDFAGDTVSIRLIDDQPGVIRRLVKGVARDG